MILTLILECQRIDIDIYWDVELWVLEYQGRDIPY